VCNRADDDCDGRVDDGVCLDAATRPDATVDVAMDRAADVARDAAPDAANDAAEDVEGEAAADADDDAAKDVEDDADFEDVGPKIDGDDVSPDREDTLEGGCGCRTARAPTGASWAALALAALTLVRRRGRR